MALNKYHDALVGKGICGLSIIFCSFTTKLLSFFYRGPLTFQNNLAERLGVAHTPVQILSCLKCADLIMVASEQIKLSYTAVM